jgi:fatty-acyl-CoA synthase
MAALVLDGSFDLAAFHRHLAASLPNYAQPLFLRIRGEMDVTSTFKQKKIDFVAQGFDPAATSDPIYFGDPVAQTFVRIDPALYGLIRGGGFRL